VDRQEADCRAYVKSQGLTVVEVFRENDTSAFKQRTIVLPSGEKVADSLSAAGLYVGMTRGRTTNLLHVVAENLTDARGQFTAAMGRDRADRGLEAATRHAIQDAAGLVADGPAVIVNTEKTRLAGLIAQAEANVERWQQRADTLDRLQRQHQQAREQQQAVAQTAQARHERTRAAVLATLTAAATADARTLETARDAMEAADQAARLGDSQPARPPGSCTPGLSL
jgi:hypothetical protein